MHTGDADKTCFSSPKFTSEFVHAKCQVCCTYQHPRGTPLHNRAGVRAWNFENDRYNYKRYSSLIRVAVATISL